MSSLLFLTLRGRVFNAQTAESIGFKVEVFLEQLKRSNAVCVKTVNEVRGLGLLCLGGLFRTLFRNMLFWCSGGGGGGRYFTEGRYRGVSFNASSHFDNVGEENTKILSSQQFKLHSSEPLSVRFVKTSTSCHQEQSLKFLQKGLFFKKKLKSYRCYFRLIKQMF